MKRFKNILVVCSDSLGSDDVIEQATALASANDAKLTLAADAGKRGTRRWKEEMHKRLRRIASAIEPTVGREIEIRVIDGAPSESIVREVDNNGHDLVITSSETGESMAGSLIGGGRRRLMKHCRCPVWFLTPGQTVPYKRVLAVVDPCLSDGKNLSLYKKVLEIAVSLSVSHGAELHLLHAWEVDGPDYERNRSELWPEDRKRLIEKHVARRRAAIDEFIHSVAGPKPSYKIHLSRKLLSPAIRERATDVGIDVVVMRADDGYNLPFLLGGSMAETMLNSLPCSVLSVTPDKSSASAFRESRATARTLCETAA